MKLHVKQLKALNACSAAVKWAARFPTLQAAWYNCERSDWLLWLVRSAPPHPANTKQQIIKCACAIARTVLHLVPEVELQSLRAIETAEAWVEGKATKNECGTAADAAVCVIYNAAADANVAAADAAYFAIAGAYFAVTGAPYDIVANAAADAAYFATIYDASTAAADADAITIKRREIANIVRQYLACPDINASLEKSKCDYIRS